MSTQSRRECGVDVVLLGYPLALGVRATEHYSEVFREFALLVSTGRVEPGSVPERVSTLVSELERRGARNMQLEQVAEEARRRGETTADLVLRDVPASAVTISRELHELMDRADDYSRDGRLLALTPDADVVAFRRWYLDELIGQLCGGDPTPWPGEGS